MAGSTQMTPTDSSRRWAKVGFALACGTAIFSHGNSASAQGIKSPGSHLPYSVELEPHLLLDEVIDDDDLGVGLQATFKLLDPGFVSSINDTAGIGVGFNFVDRDRCHNHGNGNRHCRGRDVWFVPVVAHWSFWFSDSWSAFGEAGLVIEFFENDDDDEFDDGDDRDDRDLDIGVSIGGRYNFNDSIALTLRLGTHGNLMLGASFFL